jgi:hypothetical protein
MRGFGPPLRQGREQAGLAPHGRKGGAMPEGVSTVKHRWKLGDNQTIGKRAPRFVVLGRDGVPCPRCGLPTEVRAHHEITEKQLRQPYYFSRWFYCRNPNCVVTSHMSEMYKVHPPR